MRLGIWCAIRSRAVGGLAPISARGGAARTLTQSSVRRGPLRSRDPSRADTNWARIEPLSVTTTSRRAASGVSRGDADTDTPAPDAKLAIQFTCKVCETRQQKTFSKLAYTKGIVIINCDGCESKHLIADNLGWFDHVEGKNVEEFLAEKGEEVKRDWAKYIHSDSSSTAGAAQPQAQTAPAELPDDPNTK